VMIRFILFAFIMILGGALTHEGDWKVCTNSSAVGENCTLSAFDPLSTQFVLGMSEVACKMGFIESASYSDLNKYLMKDDMIVPLVKGPNALYMINGHHLVRALVDSDIDLSWKIVYCTIVDDLSSYTDEEEFWSHMVKNEYVWLYDNKGYQPVDPQYIPRNIELLLNDPYRSLAWMSRNYGAYARSLIPFADFMWANYYRDNLVLNGTSNVTVDSPISWSWCNVRPFSPMCFPEQQNSLASALPWAMKIATQPEASSLPGYGKGVDSPEDCGSNSTFIDLIYADFFNS